MSDGALPPLVDPDTGATLAARLMDTLAANLPELGSKKGAEPDQASAALVAVASRFGEVVIERINQAPTKNFLAFLDLLGTSPLPPQPAQVPLTFTVAAGSVTDAVVPAATQVSAVPREGELVPVTFETSRELTAISATLQALIGVDAERDLIGDHGALASSSVAGGVAAFGGDRPNEHTLYISQRALLANAHIDTLTVAVELHADSPADAPDVRVLAWDVWDGAVGAPVTLDDGTNGLRMSGTLSVAPPTSVPEQVLNGTPGRWLRCRLATPVSAGDAPAQGMVRSAQLPVLRGMRLSARFNRAGIVPDAAFANGEALDVTHAFLPFGDKPAIGDVLYLGSRDAFGHPGAAIALDTALVNPLTQPGSVPSPDLQLRWEAWDGVAWALLGITSLNGATTGSPSTFADDGKAFTQSGKIRFTLPPSVATRKVNGVESNWIRVQIVAGNYGVDATYVSDDSQPAHFRLVPPTLRPPLVASLSMSVDVTTAAVVPDAVVAFNNGQFDDLTADLAAGRAAPFVALENQLPALYAAFTLPPARKTFPNRAVSLYHGLRQPPYGERVVPLGPALSIQSGDAGSTVIHRFTLTNTAADAVHFDLAALGGAWPSSVEPAHVTLMGGLSTEIKVSVVVPAAAPLGAEPARDRGFLTLRSSATSAVSSVGVETRVGDVARRRRTLRYEYWNGTAWARLVATDDTELLQRPGVIEFLGPADFAPSRRFGLTAYWVRALFDAGDDQPIRLQTFLPNTVMAANAVTARNEVLGSSDASANQRFRTTRAPLLANPVLEVREAGDVWTPWTQVTDFHASGPQDRHYVLDHSDGTVKFGDGVHGRIPPRGVANIRMASYRTGGGVIGNRDARTIVQLKTTVPYVDAVANLEPSTGGADAETMASLVGRAPRALRHGNRAVAIEDYADLARSASAEVARVKVVPLRDLRADPLSADRVPGATSVIVVPATSDARPTPSVTLLGEVEEHLRAHMTPTADVAVVGPLYVRVDVIADVALRTTERAGEIEDAIRSALSQFLHPLSGGRNGAGWDFGRQPVLSDLYAVISAVPGVDHVRGLAMQQVEDVSHTLETGRFLVYSGQHTVTLGFVGAE